MKQPLLVGTRSPIPRRARACLAAAGVLFGVALLVRLPAIAPAGGAGQDDRQAIPAPVAPLAQVAGGASAVASRAALPPIGCSEHRGTQPAVALKAIEGTALWAPGIELELLQALALRAQLLYCVSYRCVSPWENRGVVSTQSGRGSAVTRLLPPPASACKPRSWRFWHRVPEPPAPGLPGGCGRSGRPNDCGPASGPPTGLTPPLVLPGMRDGTTRDQELRAERQGLTSGLEPRRPKRGPLDRLQRHGRLDLPMLRATDRGQRGPEGADPPEAPAGRLGRGARQGRVSLAGRPDRRRRLWRPREAHEERHAEEHPGGCQAGTSAPGYRRACSDKQQFSQRYFISSNSNRTERDGSGPAGQSTRDASSPSTSNRAVRQTLSPISLGFRICSLP